MPIEEGSDGRGSASLSCRGPILFEWYTDTDLQLPNSPGPRTWRTRQVSGLNTEMENFTKSWHAKQQIPQLELENSKLHRKLTLTRLESCVQNPSHRSYKKGNLDKKTRTTIPGCTKNDTHRIFKTIDRFDGHDSTPINTHSKYFRMCTLSELNLCVGLCPEPQPFLTVKCSKKSISPWIYQSWKTLIWEQEREAKMNFLPLNDHNK